MKEISCPFISNMKHPLVLTADLLPLIPCAQNPFLTGSKFSCHLFIAENLSTTLS